MKLMNEKRKKHKRGEVLEERYYKYGVEVTKEFCQQDFSKIDLKKVFKEEDNMQMLMVYIRIIGMEEVLKRIDGKMIEMTDDGEYKLLETKIGGTKIRFIRMICHTKHGIYMINTYQNKHLKE